MTVKKTAILALSGGLDSSSLLLHLLREQYEVHAISFLYGQKHQVELEKAQELIGYLREHQLSVKHSLLHLEGLKALLFSALTTESAEIPEGHYSQESMRVTVVPNRNKIFLSILQAAALSHANLHQEPVKIALGIHAGDEHTYPDCRGDFITQDFAAFHSGNWQSTKVEPYLPYLNYVKYDILKDGMRSCEVLGLSFDEVYRRTITSYHPNARGISDYKSGASVARIEAFMQLNRQDPITYADDTGLVTWETVQQYVSAVLKHP